MSDSRNPRTAAAILGTVGYAFLSTSAIAASLVDSADWWRQTRSSTFLSEGRWSIVHSAAIDSTGHLAVRKGTKEENARWVIIYGMSIAEALELQEQTDGLVVPVTLAIFPKGGIVELKAQASEDWHTLTMPLAPKLIDALVRGQEVYVQAGQSAIMYRASLTGSAKALRKALNR